MESEDKVSTLVEEIMEIDGKKDDWSCLKVSTGRIAVIEACDN